MACAVYLRKSLPRNSDRYETAKAFISAVPVLDFGHKNWSVIWKPSQVIVYDTNT